MPFEKKATNLAKRSPVYLSPVRRITRVAARARICAMTFDDGPCRHPAKPDHFRGKPLTLVIAEALERYGARGTFTVIGDTSENYPDAAGRAGTAAWNGIAYDHFPDIRQDREGGVINCPELITRLLAGGHEIAGHSYRHIPYGWTPPLTGIRKHQPDLEAVTEDLERLHKAMEDGWGYPLRLSRPPRGVEAIKGNLTVYDAYALMGYQYIAASFDGGSSISRKGYEEEVDASWRPMERLLLEDPDAFCGQIILERDGCNTARRTPVAEGIGRQLRLLTDLGYKIVTVSELLERAPFKDLAPDREPFKAAQRLLRQGWCIVYQDNTIRPEAVLTRGELAMMVYGEETIRRHIALVRSGRAPFRDMEPRHPYAAAAAQAVEARSMTAEGGRFRPNDLVTPTELAQFCVTRLGRTPPLDNWTQITHGEFFTLIAEWMQG